MSRILSALLALLLAAYALTNVRLYGGLQPGVVLILPAPDRCIGVELDYPSRALTPYLDTPCQ